jgi:hypothetical protein
MVAKKNKIKKGKDKDKDYIYISLQEATKYCNYSQEYLSLRARQKKLKAIKTKKDWMTTREWLEKYIQSHKDFKKIVKEKKIKTERPLIIVQYKALHPPENLPIERKPVLRYNLLLALILVLILATGVFGKDSFRYTTRTVLVVLKDIKEGHLNVFKNIPSLVQEFSQGFDRGLAVLSSPNGYSYITADIVDLFENHRQSVGKNFRSGYSDISDFLNNPEEIPDRVFQKYQAINDLLKKQTSLFSQQTKNLVLDFFSWFKKPEKVAVSPQQPKTEEIKNLQPEVEKPKQEEVKTKEISKVPQVQTIKEVLKEKTVTFLDQESVNRIKSLESRLGGYDQEIIGLQTDMNRRSSGFMVSPAAVQPVFQTPYFPRLSVQNGEVTLETIGSGNIVFSAASNIIASAQNLIISANLIISGIHLFSANSSSTVLTVVQNGTGNIVEFKDAGISVFTIADAGYATLAVNASTTPAFLIRSSDATTTFASSTFFAINATSTFIGRFIDLKKGITSVFYLDDSGNAVFTGTLSAATSSITGDLIVAGNILPSTTTTYTLGSSAYKWANIYTATATIGSTITIGSYTLSGSGTTTISTDAGSLILNPSGNVGIGTTTPNSTLQVYGTLSAATTTVVGNLTVKGNLVPYDAAGTYYVGTGSPEVRWDYGYFNELNVLNLAAASTSISGTAAETFTINSDAASNENSFLAFYRGGALNTAVISWSSSTNQFGFNFPINLSGTGQISGPGAAGLTLTNAGNLMVQSTGSGDLTASSSGNLIFVTAGNEIMRIASTTGYVGIGTTNPASKLQVLDNTDSPYTVRVINAATGTNTGSAVVSFGNTGTANAILYSGILNSGYTTWTMMQANSAIFVAHQGVTEGINIGTIGAADIKLWTNTQERMRIASTTGNVGIGTAAPGALLHIGANNTSFTGDIALKIQKTLAGGGSSYDRGIYLRPLQNANAGGNTIALQIEPEFASGITQTTAYGIYMQPATTGNITTWYGLYIDAKSGAGTIGTNYDAIFNGGGNVGIGTAAPGGTLDVERSSNDSGVILRVGNAGADVGFDFSRSSTTGALSIQGRQAGNNNIVLAPTSGNVGIGTASPGYKLEVDGALTKTLNSSGWGLNVKDTTTGGAAGVGGAISFAAIRGTDLGVFNAGAIAGAKSNSTDGNEKGDLAFYSGSGTGGALAERMRIQWDGNVGIGTAAPLKPLHVLNTSAGAAVNPLILTNQSSNANTAVGIQFNPTALSGADNYIGNILVTKLNAAADYTSRMDFIVTNSAGTPQTGLSVLGGTPANVGIGTAAPGTKLEIAGDADTAKIRLNYVPTAYPTTYLADIWYDGGLNFIGLALQSSDGGVNTGNILINPYGGKVGIATTSPSASLQVYGNIKTNLPGAGTGYALCHTTAAGTITQEIVDCTSAPGADYAEMYPTEQGLEPGDLVAPSQTVVQTSNNNNVAKLVKTNHTYQSSMIGVVSDPSQATDFNVIGYNVKEEDNPLPIALNGRVLVKVSLENGPISIGDALTSAFSPGTAMKATKAGRTIGLALESFEGTIIQCHREEISSSTATTTEVCQPLQSQTGKIMVFINPHWQGNDLSMEQNIQGQIVNIDFKQELANLGLMVNEYGVLEVKKLKAQVVETEELKVISQDIKKSGITVLDRATGQPFCIYVENSQMQNMAGECTGSVPASTNESLPTSASSSPEISTSTSPTAETPITETTPTEISTSTLGNPEPISETPTNAEAPPASEPQASLTE